MRNTNKKACFLAVSMFLGAATGVFASEIPANEPYVAPAVEPTKAEVLGR